MAAKQDYLCQKRPQLQNLIINFKSSFFTLISNLNSTVTIILIRMFELYIELFLIQIHTNKAIRQTKKNTIFV